MIFKMISFIAWCKISSLKILQALFVFGCSVGFLYQTLEFLFLYWKYPTVVDIQEISPSYFELPAFTICNAVGYNIDYICNGLKASACTSNLTADDTSFICGKYPEACIKDKLPDDYQYVAYPQFMQSVRITPKDHERLRIPLEEYLTCTIELAGTSESCNMENVLGSFYSKDDLPHYCYTIYSLWGKPHKKRELIQKGAIMKFHFFLNASRRLENTTDKNPPKPRYNLPAKVAVQIGVHSPYFLPSPYVGGMSFEKGRVYEMRFTLEETHLLLPPYQTNCTDYLATWRERGGKSPIDQLRVVEECRLNTTYENLGCIPLSIDFPHNYTICQSCPNGCNDTVATQACSLLADSYNQPCDSLTYEAKQESKMLTFFTKLKTRFVSVDDEGVKFRIQSHNCTGRNFWKEECSTIDIDVLFDEFQNTKLTYNAKFESLELFSVIGGYLGMWLGISLLTVYDYVGTLLSRLRKSLKKRKLEKRKRRSDLQSRKATDSQAAPFHSGHI